MERNVLVYDEAGHQISEFDITISGMVGSTHFSWLIECRDRPSDGAAPNSWIEQLVGRKDRHNFSKVTAVSTTGFAESARRYAQQKGIELRDVERLSPDAFASWITLPGIRITETHSEIHGVKYLISESVNDALRCAAETAVAGTSVNDKILRNSSMGTYLCATDILKSAVQSSLEIEERLEQASGADRLKLHVNLVESDAHIELETELGPVRIDAVVFDAKLSIHERRFPIVDAVEYRRSKTGEILAQSVIIPFEAGGASLAIEFHKIPDTGSTHVYLRQLETKRH